MKYAFAAVSACFAAALIAVAVITHGALDAQQSRITHIQQTDSRTISGLRSKVASLTNQVATMNTPTDPLSSYDQVCSTQATNDETGITSTYWYPCTSQAQTIPEPGN